jgi:predicted DCC family thiol-disulfide oxidoreductase YuxK
MTIENLPTDKKIIIFDGICNLCNRSVQFVIKSDKRDLYRFVPLQSSLGKDLLTYSGSADLTIDSIVLYNPPTTIYYKSEAALRIVMGLGGIYTLAKIFLWLPTTFRDAIYDYVARNRYRWYGKRESCMMPSPEVLSKFLS